MGASDSKLVFKQGIFRLSEDKNIAANDPYWTGVRISRAHCQALEIANTETSFGSSPNLLRMSSLYSLQLIFVAREIPH